jgi:hypothetical protein
MEAAKFKKDEQILESKSNCNILLMVLFVAEEVALVPKWHQIAYQVIR